MQPLFMPTEMECVIKGTIVQKRRRRREYITEAISGVAGVTQRVMLYRSLMTSTVWAPTWMLCVYVYMHLACERLHGCLCVMPVLDCRWRLVFTCLCGCLFAHTWGGSLLKVIICGLLNG